MKAHMRALIEVRDGHATLVEQVPASHLVGPWAEITTTTTTEPPRMEAEPDRATSDWTDLGCILIVALLVFFVIADLFTLSRNQRP